MAVAVSSLKRLDYVPNKPIREYMQRNGLTVGQYVSCKEYKNRRKQSDAHTRISRALGFTKYKHSNGKHYTQKYVNYELAVDIAITLGVDPIDFGV